MKPLDFDELLTQYRGAAVPSLPSCISADVLREIRLRDAKLKAEGGWFPLLFGFLRPGMVAASLSLALAVGVVAPSIARENSSLMTADGLGLHVFSSSTSSLIK